MKIIIMLVTLVSLSCCGTIGGAAKGLGDDLFRMIEFGADKIL